MYGSNLSSREAVAFPCVLLLRPLNIEVDTFLFLLYDENDAGREVDRV